MVRLLVARACSVRLRTYHPNMCSTDDQMRQRVQAEYARIDELERQISELAAHIAAATCRWLLLVAEFDRLGGWAVWGVKSCAQWLSWRCSIGPGAAREHVRVARRLEELPLVREAFASGELSYCKVRAITRVAKPTIEASLVEMARHATGAQLERLVRGYDGAMSATLDMAQRAHAQRSFSWSWDDDGRRNREHGLAIDDQTCKPRSVGQPIDYGLAVEALCARALDPG
jgi:hypothetical protein